MLLYKAVKRTIGIMKLNVLVINIKLMKYLLILPYIFYAHNMYILLNIFNG